MVTKRNPSLYERQYKRNPSLYERQYPNREYYYQAEMIPIKRKIQERNYKRKDDNKRVFNILNKILFENYIKLAN